MPGDVELLSIPVAAERIGVTRATLWRYIGAGRLPAQKVGRDWVVLSTDLEAFTRRPPGRPPKPRPASS